MGQVIKSFLGIFFAFMVAATGITVITMQMQVSEARSFKDSVVSSIEDSDFNAEVLNSCFTGAAEKDYDMEITVYGENGGSLAFSSASVAESHVAEAGCARVFLTYDVNVFGKKFEKSVQGTAK